MYQGMPEKGAEITRGKTANTAVLPHFLSLSFFDERDQLFNVIKMIVVSDDAFTVICDTVFLVTLKTVQQFLFSVTLREQRESVRLES